MFFKRFSVLALLLFALFTHLLFGQDGQSSLLVLCFGENGHVALESISPEWRSPEQSLKQKTEVESASAPSHLRCEHSQDCRDIVLALGHEEKTLLPQTISFEHTLAWSTRILNTYRIPYFSQEHTPSNPALTRLAFSIVTDPPTFRAQPTAQTETLTHTILLI